MHTVHCSEHGVVVAWGAVGAPCRPAHPRLWAPPALRTNDTVASPAIRTAKTAVTELLRIRWRVLGRVVTWVSADAQAKVDRFAGVRPLGVDAMSYERGHR